MSDLHRPLGTLTAAGDPVVLTPADAGWDRVGLRVLALAPGETRLLETGDHEAFLLPLSGGCTVDVDGERLTLRGRESVFTGVTDFAYLPRDATAEIRADRATELAVPLARCERRLTPAYGPADRVPVETRGAGPATRQVTNFGVPGAWDHADRLMACELITPDGN